MIVLSIISICLYNCNLSKNNIESLRSKHIYFLENSPFAKTKYLSKKERKQLKLPPNAYNEMLWDLTLDPSTGSPAPQRILKAQREMSYRREQTLSVDQPATMQWQERGPTNLGGRTRAILFDPNDVGNADPNDNYTRVFAGAVSGGLWVNQDITDPNAAWSPVTGLASNISITKIIADPNNPNILYIASGESYSSGQAVGNGIWKSTDSGKTWVHVFGGFQGVDKHKIINGIFYVNDIVARDLGEITELYIAVAGTYFHSSGELPQFHSVNQQGLYKSVDNGLNWNRIVINETNGKPINPNDIEIDINNNIWLTTTQSSWGHNGGEIFKSAEGEIFNLVHDFSEGVGRTELEPSQIDPNKFWVLLSQSNRADLYVTEDGFKSVTPMTTEPNDIDPGIPANDFGRQQAFYNLTIEADAKDHLFVGGINLFKSSNQGKSWEQISHWYGGYERQNVHPDQHAIVFRPENENEVVFGNDGGIYFCNDVQKPYTSIQISKLNRGYNTSQFYYGSIDINHTTQKDIIAGGTQDNGTWTATNATEGINTFFHTLDGDGAYTELDTEDNYMIASYVFDEHYFISYPDLNSMYKISLANQNGSFINNAILDKNLDIIYYDQSDGGIFKIGAAYNFKNGKENIKRFELTHLEFDRAPSALNVSPYSKTHAQLYLGLVNGKLFRIDNTSSTSPNWVEITGEDFLGSISDIEFGTTQRELFVTMHNYGVDNIWFSNDAGQSWRPIEGDLPDIPVRCILQNPQQPKEVIIGTPIGVW